MIRLDAGAVLDASVVVKLLVPEPDTELAERLLGHVTSSPRWLGAPELLVIECGNALWLRMRRRSLAAAEGERQLVRLRRFAAGLDLRPLSSLMLPAWRVATALGVTMYDACYVALAELQGVPLVTADRALERRCASLPERVVHLRSVVAESDG